MSRSLLPIALRAGKRHALIVGGGSVALRKARALLAGGFDVLVVAADIGAALRALAASAPVTLRERPYEPADVNGAALVVAATGDESVDGRVVADARAAGVLVCDASAPERGDFAMLATSRLGDMTLALESGGASPSFSRRMLSEIESHFGEPYARAAHTLARIRKEIRTRLPRHERIALMRRLSSLPIDELAAFSQRRSLLCATRSSALATTQARTIAALVAQRGVSTQLLDVTTAGDRDQRRALHELGEVNVFVKELEFALRERRADYAVHSCKDLPSVLAEGMRIAAISAREDARDAFCSERYESFASLPPGAKVGTSSPRRRVQLHALRSDLRYENLRGNVDTRLRKLREGEYDAIVLAMAGLARLRSRAKHTVPFSLDEIVPAAGQGALAVEVRVEDELLAYELRAAANDPAAERCIVCERALLRALNAGCSAPVGAHAETTPHGLRLRAAYALDGEILHEHLEAPVTTLAQAESLGAELGQRLIARIPAGATG